MTEGHATGRVYGIAKALYHRGAAALDATLYPMRRRRAITRVRSAGAPRSILVICHGNVCRSPYLAATLRRALPNVRVASAGFLRAERSVPENSLIACARRGLDLSAFRSRTILPRMLEEADLIITMDARQATRLTHEMAVPAARIIVAGDLDPIRGERRTIRDPWQQPLAVFESSFDRLDRCAGTLVELLRRA